MRFGKYLTRFVIIVVCPQYAGVFHLQSSSVAHVSDCTLNSNHAWGNAGHVGWSLYPNGYGGGVFYIKDTDSEAYLSGCTVNDNGGYFGGVFHTELEGFAQVVNSELSNNGAPEHAGVAFLEDLTSSIQFDGCTVCHNSGGVRGGVFRGVGVVALRCNFTGNIAEWGGVVYGAGKFIGCFFANNTAIFGTTGLGEGGVAYVDASGTPVSFEDCTFEHNSAASGLGSVAFSAADDDDDITIKIDHSTFSNNGVPALTSDAPVVVRNTLGLSGTDTANVPLLRCDDPDTRCDSQYCLEVFTEDDDNTLLGISCYCEADGISSDPDDVASCASSASMSDPVAGVVITSNADVWVYVDKPQTGRMDVQFSNLGDVRLEWDLNVTSNPEQLGWNAPTLNGSLTAGDAWSIALQLSSEGLQAREAAYVSSYTLSGSSPEPTPIPESRSIDFTLHTVISAMPIAAASHFNITNAATLAAAGDVEFEVTSVDVTGMVILDATNVVYSADLVHSASSASVTCSISYDPSSKRSKGICRLQGLEAGGFGLTVTLGLDMVGSGTQFITVERCPQSFELSDDRLSCTCPAGRYKLGSTCVNCKEGTYKPASGRERADCVECQTAADATTNGLTSNANRTACDSCEDGYYRVEGGGDCRICPVGAQCTMDSDVSSMVISSGHWRASPESADVRTCRFGKMSCPKDVRSENRATGPDQYCAPGYIGPLCSECHDDFFESWDGAGACQVCAAGKSHLPTIGLLGTVVAIGVLFVGAGRKCRKKTPDEPDDAAPNPSGLSATINDLYTLAKVKVFTLFLTAQVQR